MKEWRRRVINRIKINKENRNEETKEGNRKQIEIQINQGVKQGYPMSPTLVNMFIDEVIRQ
jgi:hypothetical protein